MAGLYWGLCWALGLRMGSDQLQNFHARTQAEAAVALWDMLLSCQREEAPKGWHKFSMLLKVTGWSWHIITSAHIPLSQISHNICPKSVDPGRILLEKDSRQGEKGKLLTNNAIDPSHWGVSMSVKLWVHQAPAWIGSIMNWPKRLGFPMNGPNLQRSTRLKACLNRLLGSYI